MKNILFLLCLGIGFASFAQGPTTNGTILTDPISVHKRQTGTDTSSQLATMSWVSRNYPSLNFTNNLTGLQLINGPHAYGTEIASTHVYTVHGTYPVVTVTAATNDTLFFQHSKLASGQIISLLTTSNPCQLTNIFLDTGNVQGSPATSTPYSWNQATATPYKAMTLRYDGANLWILK